MPILGGSTDERKYRKLLGDVLPVVIQSDQEYRRLLQALEQMMELPEEEITEEEGRLLELLSVLVEDYEDRVHPLPNAEPRKMLAHLLNEKGMKPSDLWQVLPKSRVSEILSGKRSISKSQAKELAALFRVPVELFL
jgi:HTH-type transcriptional regulator / antitoxin HigA